MDVQREEVAGPSGTVFVVRAVPLGSVDTGELRWSPVAHTRRLSMYVELFGWLRHRLRYGGRWAVIAGVVGVAGNPDRIVHSVVVADRRVALDEFGRTRRKIQQGDIG